MNPQQVLSRAVHASLDYLCSRSKDWQPTSRLDVDELLISLPTPEQPHYAAELFWSRSGKRRRMEWPGRASNNLEPLVAQLMQTETLIFTLTDCFILLSVAAIVAERPIEATYPYFHERYRAHPDGHLELVEEPRKQTDSA